MLTTKITTAEMAKALRISEAGVLDLMKTLNFDGESSGLTVRQAAEFMQKVENDDILTKKRAAEYLERVARRFLVIVDTCTLLTDNFSNLYLRLSALLQKEGKALIVPSSVMAELKHLLLTRPELRSKIAALFTFLEEEIEAGRMEVMGESTESFGDQQILSLLSKLFLAQDVMLVTSDKNLSLDALKQNRLMSVKGHEIVVARVNKFGYLSRFTPQSYSTVTHTPPVPRVNNIQ